VVPQHSTSIVNRFILTVLVQSFSDKPIDSKMIQPSSVLVKSRPCLRYRFGSWFTPPQNWGSVHESSFFLAFIHLLPPRRPFNSQRPPF
jgi:hypothetical protein